MKLVKIDSLTPGDKLAMPINTSSGKVILNSGCTLSESYIHKLKQLGIRLIYIHDDRFGDIEVTENLDINVRNKISQAIQSTYEGLQKGKSVDEFLIKRIAEDIIDYVRNLKDKSVSILSFSTDDEYIIGHSINVALLAAFVGNRMDFTFSQLCDLVTGAIIHDFGRENCKEEKPGHVQKGFELMRKCRGIDLHSSKVCYEHHENYDGSGYPRKIKGSSISLFASIVRVADIYDNFLHGYENNIPLMPHQAYECILALSGSVVDPKIVEVFRDTIVFYPNGCPVLLNNNLEAIVVRQNIGSPHRPVVRTNNSDIIEDIDLLNNLTMFVKDVLVLQS